VPRITISSAETLAERSGVSTRTIEHLESGRIHPRRATVIQLIDALGLEEADWAALPLSPRARLRAALQLADQCDR
jgi:transcriptional regulator with XRE-family HTH domain